MNILIETAEAWGLALNDQQLDQFAAYADELQRWNKRVNLTAITDAEGIAVRLGHGHGNGGIMGADVAFEDAHVANGQHGSGHAAVFQRFDDQTAVRWPRRRPPLAAGRQAFQQRAE